jgi:hypothetical protein
MTKANSVQILLSGHNKETISKDIFKMFNPHKAPEIDQQGDYTILKFKDIKTARKGITAMNKEGERGETQIKTEVYHSLLDEMYDIPPRHPITKIDNTKNQAQPEEKKTQHGEIYTHET